MSWAFRNAGTVGTSFNATCTPGAPASIIANDLLIILASELLGADARPVVSGWTDMTLAVNWTTGSAVYMKIATGGDAMPAIPSWGNQFQNAVCLVYSGGPTSLTGLVDPVSTDRNYNSTGTLAFTGIVAPANPGSLILAISFKNTLGNASPVLTETGGLIGFTRRVTQWPNANRPTIVVDELVQGAAATVSLPGMNMNFTEASTQAGHSTILALIPAPATSTPPGENEFPATALAARRAATLHEFWTVPIEILQVPPAQIPPADQEFPPFLLRARSNVQLGEEQGIPRPLVGADRVLTPVDWEYSWDPPQLLPALRSIEKGFTALDITLVTNYPPYLEFNWTNPPGPRQWHRGFEASVNLNLIGKDAMPLGALHNIQQDPPPRPRQPVSNLEFSQSGLALFLTVQVKPPVSADLPVPATPRRPVADFIAGTPPVMLAGLTKFPTFLPSTDLPLRKARLPATLLSIEVSQYSLYYSQQVLPFGKISDALPPRTRRKESIFSITERSAFLTPGGPNPPPPPPGPLGTRHMGRIITPPIKVGEAPAILFDFLSGMKSPSEVVVSASAVCTRYSGTDPNPQFIIDGAPVIDQTIVLQQVLPTIVGNIYDITCTAITNAGQILKLDTYLAIVPNLP